MFNFENYISGAAGPKPSLKTTFLAVKLHSKVLHMVVGSIFHLYFFKIILFDVRVEGCGIP
jgi:hypothetical protein